MLGMIGGNDILAGLRAGEEISIRDLRELNQALRLNATGHLRKGGVNYPLQGVGYDSNTLPGGQFAPLVPQSIQGMLDSATFDEEHIVAWKLLNKVSVTSPMYEYNVRRAWGSSAMSQFVREGGVPGISESNFERKTIRMKYAATFRQVTDPAAMTGLMHPSPSAIAVASMDGMMELVQKTEASIFHASSAVNPLEFDGLYASVRTGAPSNYRDAEGDPTSLEELQEILGRMVNPPLYARPTAIWVDHRVWQNLNNQMLQKYGRMDITRPRSVVGSVDEVWVGTSYGRIPVVAIPFLTHREHPITLPEGDGAPAAISPSYAFAATQTGSKFKTADITGLDFHYILEAIGDEGAVNFAASAAVTHTSVGGASNITVDDSAVGTYGSSSIRFYNVFRAAVATGAGAPTDPNEYWFVGRYGRNLLGAGSNKTLIQDLNQHRPQSSPVYIVQNRRDCLEWANFLDLTRRPITITRSATTQFMIMLFGALKVGIPTKHWILDNVGYG